MRCSLSDTDQYVPDPVQRRKEKTGICIIAHGINRMRAVKIPAENYSLAFFEDQAYNRNNKTLFYLGWS